MANKLLLGASVVVITAAIGYGLMETGGPGQQRKERMDGLKTSRIEQLSRAVEQYYQKEHALPPGLDALQTHTSSTSYLYDRDAVEDPETGKHFDYHPTGKTTYQLCSRFDTDTLDTKENRDKHHRGSYYSYSYTADKWQHPRGEHCFALEAPEK